MDLIIGMTYVRKNLDRHNETIYAVATNLREPAIDSPAKGPSHVEITYLNDYQESWIKASEFRRQFRYTEDAGGRPKVNGAC